MNIHIPSKQRLTSKAIRDMVAEGLDPYVYVNINEYEDYQYAYPGARLICHDLDDIGEIRQFILTIARVADEQLHWQIDDDVRVLKQRIDGKHRNVPWTVALEGMEQELAHWPTVALGGPLPVQYAWSSMDPTLNGHANGIVCIRTAAPVNYMTDVIEDWDIVFQAWSQGWHTIRFSEWAYDFPKMGTTPGGMQEAYDAGWQAPRRAATLAKWPMYIYPSGRMDRRGITKPERIP
jgi:hypothetical protein